MDRIGLMFGRTGRVTAFLLAACLAQTCLSQDVATTKLRYGWQPKQTVSYHFEITADRSSDTEELKGTVRYTPNSVEGEATRLTASGSLVKFTKSKPVNAASRTPFGPRFPPPGLGRPFDPFARSPFTGLSPSTNELLVSSRGEVQAMKGTSQLPYLLGNLSVLIFEPLPDQAQAAWTVRSGVSVTEGSRQSSISPFFRPPFDRQQEEKSSLGGETASYRVTGIKNGLATIEKTYKLSVPALDKDDQTHDVDGSGTWTFNSTLGLPESLDFKQNVVVKKGAVSITYPVTIKYHRLTEEELQRMKEEAQKRAEEAQRLAEENKVKAAQPLEPAEKQRLLADLASGNVPKMSAALHELEKRTPPDPDPEIVRAIEPLMKHANKLVSGPAEKAMMSWSPKDKEKLELNRAYRGPGFVKPSGIAVGPETKLFVGQILLVHDGSVWNPAEITALNSDGTAAVHYRGWGNRHKTVPRSELQLAPPEVDQPSAKNPSAAAEGAVAGDPPKPAPAAANNPFATAEEKGIRTWTDASGQFKIEGQMVGITDGNVKLRRADGKEIAVPLSQLSQADQDFVAAQQKR